MQLDPERPHLCHSQLWELCCVLEQGQSCQRGSCVRGVSLFRSFNEVKDDVQRYLSQVEHNELLEKNDKKELYLLFVNCLEVRAGP